MKRLGTVAHRFGERRRADRHDHTFLKLQRAFGVLPAVDHVHHRHGQRARARAAEIPEQRHATTHRCRARRRERNAEYRVRTEFRFIRRAVESRSSFSSISRCAVASSPSIAGPSISLTASTALLHALPAIALLIAVAQLDRFVRARRCARGHHRFFDRAEARRDGHGDRRIAARIEHFARVDAFDERPAAAT